MKPRKDKRSKGMYRQSKTLNEYLLSRFIPKANGCWDWTKSLDHYGYSHRLGCKWSKLYNKTKAHQLSYICWKGAIPEGLCVCHKCDNRKCINPEHLFLGTHEDNRLDMIAKNRQKGVRGEDNHKAKLTIENIYYIRNNKDIKTCMELAKELGVTYSLISQVWRKEVWGHVA